MDTLAKNTDATTRDSGPSPVHQPEGAGQVTVSRSTQRPRVIVVGGGFAGLNCALELSGSDVDVTLIDRHNYHLFQPLLYQVATAALEPADISGPFRQLLHGKNVHVLMGDVESVDVERRAIHLIDRTIDYDYLVIATGAAHSYFGHDEWACRAPGLKTVEDALEIRRRVLYAYEAAERELDSERRRAWLTFVVIGGGPTGVELAGALAEISRQTRARDFRNIDPKKARVVLLEGLPRVLTAYSEDLSSKARHSLERLGVEVQTGTMVTSIDGHEVKSKNMTIAARTVLWAAGVAASPLARSLGTELDKAGRVHVTPQLTVPGHDEIFVTGDLVNLKLDGKELPGLAPVAMAQGKHAAANVLRAIRNEPLRPFKYFDRGSFAVIGRGAAVGVMFNRIKVHGFIAWLAWLAIHITFLVGFRNRIAVIFNWAYVYLTRRRHAQLIVGPAPLAEGGQQSAHRPAATNDQPGAQQPARQLPAGAVSPGNNAEPSRPSSNGSSQAPALRSR
jgi:NADH:quinone reductase (non-electrogenic)